MNRVQFMEQLKKLLSDISEEERQEALDYYESYFDDAGEDQEANVNWEVRVRWQRSSRLILRTARRITENTQRRVLRMSVSDRSRR